jgi:uncharacterized protein
MHIEEVDREASLRFLASRRFGRLACAHDAQPYITPINFAYHDRFIYSFSTVGRKIEWLRDNPLACVEADEIESAWKWTCVIVSGKYEELSETAAGQTGRAFAHKLLSKHDLWWEPGYARTILRGAQRPMEPVYFRVSVDEITGHRAFQT